MEVIRDSRRKKQISKRILKLGALSCSLQMTNTYSLRSFAYTMTYLSSF